MARHTMLDLETLDFTDSSVILTFGAVSFDPFNANEEPHTPIYFRVNVDEQTALGRTISESTMTWWTQQPKEAFDDAMSEEDRISLEDFTHHINRYIVGAKKIWAQGPLFDICILENLYKMLGKPIPWMYYDIRDSRTVMDMGNSDSKTSNSNAHNSLADAYCQAVAVQEIYWELGVKKK